MLETDTAPQGVAPLFVLVPGGDTVLKICPRCGKPLPASKRSHALWCSRKCRHHAGMLRRRRRQRLLDIVRRVVETELRP